MSNYNYINLKKKYDKRGYVVVKNLIEKQKINLLKKKLAELFKTCYEKHKIYLLSDVTLDWDCKIFNNKIFSLRKKYPEIFSKVYNMIKNNNLLINILNDKKIISHAANLISTKKHNLWNGEFMLRMDAPKDKRNNLGWHQEVYYYTLQTINGENGIVAWVALSKLINETNGGVQVCPSSHLEGMVSSVKKINSSKSIRKNQLISITRSVDKKILKKYKPETINANIGDVIFMNMKTFHRSGKNISNYFRLSTVSRLFDMNSKDWPL